MKTERARPLRWLWAATLVALPVTSFRYYPALFGSGTSRPLAFAPAVLYALGLVWREHRRLLPLLRERVPVALAVWMGVALLSTAWALHAPPPPLSGFRLADRALRAWISWGVGLTFFLTAALAHRHPQDVDFTLRALFVGFGIAAGWALLQWAALVWDWPPRAWLAEAQTWFSTRPWTQARVQGLAYEPSWFADQLVVLYGAWLAAALVAGYARPWKRRSLLWAAAGMAVFLLVWTYSRSGLLTTGAGFALVLPWLWFRRRGARVRLLAWALAGGGALLLLLAWAAQRSDYIRVTLHLEPGQSLVDYVVRARAGARLAYAWAAWQVYQEHPWLGVGLGGSGFYLYENLPEWSRTELRDVAYALSPEHRPVLNPKSMYARLLAETGLVGWAAWFAFGLGVAARALTLTEARSAREQMVGLAGLWLLGTMSVRWLTQDALSLPTFWLVAGVVVGHLAAVRAAGRSQGSNPK